MPAPAKMLPGSIFAAITQDNQSFRTNKKLFKNLNYIFKQLLNSKIYVFPDQRRDPSQYPNAQKNSPQNTVMAPNISHVPK